MAVIPQIVAGSTASFTYYPEREPDDTPLCALDGGSIANTPVPAGATWEDGYVITLEADETEDLSGDQTLIWTWTWDTGQNTVLDREPFTVVDALPVTPTVTANTNSYVSLADADTYMAGRLGTTAWDEANDADRAAALLMATREIDALPLRGKKVDADQYLEFPRAYWGNQTAGSVYSEEHERFSRRYLYQTGTGWYPQTAVPQRVKDAQCEEALALLLAAQSTDRVSLQQQGVVRVRIGDFEEQYASASNPSAALAVSGKLRSVEALGLMRMYIAGNTAIR